MQTINCSLFAMFLHRHPGKLPEKLLPVHLCVVPDTFLPCLLAELLHGLIALPGASLHSLVLTWLSRSVGPPLWLLPLLVHSVPSLCPPGSLHDGTLEL